MRLQVRSLVHASLTANDVLAAVGLMVQDNALTWKLDSGKKLSSTLGGDDIAEQLLCQPMLGGDA